MFFNNFTTVINSFLLKILKFNKKLKYKFKNLFLKFFIPSKTKRLIFISTILAAIKDINEPDEKLIHRLNNLLNIADRDKAMVLPMYFGIKFWNKKLPYGITINSLPNKHFTLKDIDNKNLTLAQLRIVGNTVIHNTPDWLRYGSRRSMRTDLLSLFSLLPKIENNTFMFSQ